MKKTTVSLLFITLCAVTAAGMLASCGSKKKVVLNYHIADKEEAVSCYTSNDEYFSGFSGYDIDYRLQKKDGDVEAVKQFGASQMEEFTDEEKELLEKTFDEMERKLKEDKLTLPEMDEIVLIKSTQEEECGSGAYTHGTQIYLGQQVLDLLGSDKTDEKDYARYVLWHEVFHCLTRNNPDFRKEMYSIIHFTAEDNDYEIPPSVRKQFISNPDVEHHNSHATFRIDGKDIECFAALVATEPFKKKGDSFFDSITTALVPVDGSDTYYVPDDAENFWEVFGENTDYVIDPEECLADNFGFALTYGTDGREYKNPEIIEAILSNISE